jgi:hypothetical protein
VFPPGFELPEELAGKIVYATKDMDKIKNGQVDIMPQQPVQPIAQQFGPGQQAQPQQPVQPNAQQFGLDQQAQPQQPVQPNALQNGPDQQAQPQQPVQPIAQSPSVLVNIPQQPYTQQYAGIEPRNPVTLQCFLQ